MPPLISVLMPVYNSKEYVGKAIESVLAQTMGDFKFYIYDDCSTDGSEDEILKYKDSRIIYKREPKNEGYVPILNKILRFCNTEMVARIDSDDFCVENRFEAQLELFRNNPNVGICGSSAILISDDENLNGQVWKQPERHEEILFRFSFDNPIIHPSVMFRRSVVDKIGYYNLNFMPSEDLDYWIRASKYFKCFNLQEPLIYYRHHLSQISEKMHKTQKLNADKLHLKFIEESLKCSDILSEKLLKHLRNKEKMNGMYRVLMFKKIILSNLPLPTKRILVRTLKKND